MPISAEEKRVLKVGTVDNYLPCSDLVDGNFEGLSVDMWRAIAEKIKYITTFLLSQHLVKQ
ncbi:hypothetical protein [Prochlorococcus marinus]|uniref:Uncharacterized protein n=1 Tax=Prochlorococcus marinus str. P0902-H212 TaxID=1620696 RepID=A0A0D5A2V6_PROMR|nr:hypothetical protein [Prochlorococcus marinus]AJW30513.1 hypothetical protein FA02_0247 [Prochlorococcus marinus str. P0902-H212]